MHAARSGLLMAAGSAVWLLAGCQSGESAPGSITEKTQEGSGPGNQSREIQGEDSRQSIPDAETLRQFLGTAESADPHEHHAHAEPLAPAPLAKTAATLACNIDFNNTTVLGTLPDKAWDTFAYSPHYNMSCGGVNATFWLYVQPMYYNHYHLSYQDPWICFDPFTKKKMGRYSTLPWRQAPKCEWIISGCNYNTVDPGTLARQIHPHDKNEKVKIYVLDQSRTRRAFNLKSLVLPPHSDVCAPEYGKIRLWIKVKNTQAWYYWNSISPGKTWTPAPGEIQNGLDEVRISSPGDYGWKVDDIKLDVVY